MSNTILLKRSDISNSIPSTGNLVPGELALNFADGNLFFKDAANNIVLLSSTKLVSVTGNITGNNIIGNTSGQFGNITISGSNINSDTSAVIINSNNSDVDFAINGNAAANIFYVDADLGTVSIGTSAQVGNSILSLNATSSMIIPVGNVGQRPDPAQVGMLRFNTTNDTVEFYRDAEGWQSAAQQFTLIASEIFSGSGYSTVFTLNSSQTTDSVIVSINGVVQIPGTAYTVSGTTLTFSAAPAAGYTIEVRSLTTTTTVTQLSNSPGTAVVAVSETSGTVDITGNLIPVSNAAQTLGNATNAWKSLFVSGNTIFLGPLQLKAISSTEFGVFQSDGVTTADLDVGNIDVAALNQGTSTIGIAGLNGNAYVTVAGTSNVAVFSNTGVAVSGALTATGNITGDYFVGNGSLLSGIDATSIQNGTSNVRVVSSNGNVSIGINGVGDVAVISSLGISTTAQVTATGNVTGGNLVTAGIASLSSIVKTGANGVGNIGSATNTFNTVFARSTSALYADIAENYLADAEYVPGTVVIFGGSAEVTMAHDSADTRIAGIVTTKPSYVMNAGLTGQHVACVALLGRVPCRVLGPISKGSMLVSAGSGYASACAVPVMGTVIGKSLEDFNGAEGVIEVAVGKI